MLNDQYGTQHVSRFPRDKISVLLFAASTGSAQLKAWIKPIYARYQDILALYGVADLTAVPEFFQSFVPLAVRAQVQYPVMLDWEGTVSRDYASQQGQTNLFVVNTQGDIVLKVVGSVSAARLQRVLAQINGLLATQAQ